jgi:hypothetical protein
MKRKKGRGKVLSVILLFVMLIGIVPCRETVQAASGGAIITDSADFDVFLNVDPSYNVDANVLADKVGGYLDQLIQAGGGDKNYRINTASTQIDPTDLTKWHVYDHYDMEMKKNGLPIILAVEIMIFPRLGIMVL